jgi:hypothetical protein
VSGMRKVLGHGIEEKKRNERTVALILDGED